MHDKTQFLSPAKQACDIRAKLQPSEEKRALLIVDTKTYDRWDRGEEPQILIVTNNNIYDWVTFNTAASLCLWNYAHHVKACITNTVLLSSVCKPDKQSDAAQLTLGLLFQLFNQSEELPIPELSFDLDDFNALVDFLRTSLLQQLRKTKVVCLIDCIEFYEQDERSDNLRQMVLSLKQLVEQIFLSPESATYKQFKSIITSAGNSYTAPSESHGVHRMIVPQANSVEGRVDVGSPSLRSLA